MCRWINKAFILGPQTWVRLITNKNRSISKKITQEVLESCQKYSKRMYEYWKWSHHKFRLYFGSIETFFIHQRFAKATFSSFFNHAILAKYVHITFFSFFWKCWEQKYSEVLVSYPFQIWQYCSNAKSCRCSLSRAASCIWLFQVATTKVTIWKTYRKTF